MSVEILLNSPSLFVTPGGVPETMGKKNKKTRFTISHCRRGRRRRWAVIRVGTTTSVREDVLRYDRHALLERILFYKETRGGKTG